MIFIDAFFIASPCGDAVIWQILCGYQAAAPRLFGNCVAVIGHHLAVMRLFGPVGPVRLVGHVGLRDGVCAPKRESGSLGRVLWWA